MMITPSFLLIFALSGLCSGASTPNENGTATQAPSTPTATVTGSDTETSDLKWLHAVGKQQVNRTQAAASEQEPEGLASANWLSFLASEGGPKTKDASSPVMQPDDSHLLAAMSMIPTGRRRFDDNAALASTGQLRGNQLIMPDSEMSEFSSQLRQQLGHLSNDVAIDEDALMRTISSGVGMKPEQRMHAGFGAPAMARAASRSAKPIRPLVNQAQFQQQMTADRRSGPKSPTKATNTYYSTKNLNRVYDDAAQKDEQPVELDEIFKDDDRSAVVGKRADNAADNEDDESQDDESPDEASSLGEEQAKRLRTGASELRAKDELERRPLVHGIEDSAPVSQALGSVDLDRDQQEEGEQSSVYLKKARHPKQAEIVLQEQEQGRGVDVNSNSNANDPDADDESSAASHLTKSATDLQAAAGHHHGHSHGHYYQYVEVPKKKAWKFGFKRGNHKHTIMREEKGYKNKFHSSFKWHAKEKCKKHHKCASHGKMTWHYEHHDKKKGHY